jgi:peroxiredoxin Q/BCP
MERRRPCSGHLVLVCVLLASMLMGMRETAALEVGEKAPDFTLLSTTGDKISLSQFQGKQFVLIEFYGADFAPTCSENLSARKADHGKFQHLNVQVLAISGDNPFSQKALADSLKLPYPLLSDLGLKVTRSYGVLYGAVGKVDNPDFRDVIAKRAFFLVDQQGIVRGKWIGEDLVVFPSDILLKTAQDMTGNP